MIARILLTALFLAVGAEAQWGGARTATDTLRLAHKYHVYQLAPGQRLHAPRVDADTLSSTGGGDVWHAGNDGTGSGLDADLVDGQQAWHPANDGAGSGLDADLVDGLQTAASATANTLGRRDAGGRMKAATPVATDDLANKAYVDGAAGGARIFSFDSSPNGKTGPGGGFTWAECGVLHAHSIRNHGGSLYVFPSQNAALTYFNMAAECADGVCNSSYYIAGAYMICGN